MKKFGHLLEVTSMWTNEQNNAINAPVSNMLVTAGAGSGKTAVMVERIIQKVTAEKPVDIDKILIVTFTNAAAAEIRERITSALLKKIDENPENAALQRQLSLVNKANICTSNYQKCNFCTLPSKEKCKKQTPFYERGLIISVTLFLLFL